MKRLIRIGPVALTVGASATRNEEETSAQVALVGQRRGGRALAFRIGWGFDDDLPLRPWPSYSLGNTRLTRDLTLGWFGLYVGFSRQFPKEGPWTPS